MTPSMNYVFACGMRRSGSTLQYHLALTLLERHGGGEGVWYVKPGEFAQRRAEWDTRPGTKVVKVHHVAPAIADELSGGRSKGVYVWRDPRDVVVSVTLRARYQGKHSLDNEIFVAEFFQQLERDFTFWTGQRGMYVTTYATLVDDVPGEVRALARHLGLTVTEAEARQIARRHTPDAMLRAEWVPADHINDGRAGMWRARTTDAQADRMTALLAEYAPSLAEAVEGQYA